jgi:heptosyltransferase-2
MKPIDASAIRSVLVRGTNWVGDSVMSVPALRLVRACFPSARITLLIRPWVRDVFSAVDFVDDVILYDAAGRHGGAAGFLRLARELRDGAFDLAILLQNAFGAALLTRAARIPLRLGYARDARAALLTHPVRIDPAVRRVHQSYYYAGILSGAGLLPGPPWEDSASLPPVRIGVKNEDRSAARALLAASGIGRGELVAGINPGAAYGPAKCWLADRYAEVADRLVEQHAARIVLLGSAGEVPAAQDVARRMRRPAVMLAGRTSLGQLMGVISECSLLVTNDSGPMHLAAALGVPQVAIFGSTNEIATGPLSRAARVVKHQVPCNPCLLRVCPIDFRCMTRVGVEEVWSAVTEQIGRPQPGVI